MYVHHVLLRTYHTKKDIRPPLRLNTVNMIDKKTIDRPDGKLYRLAERRGPVSSSTKVSSKSHRITATATD